jgi:hypothetical protein
VGFRPHHVLAMLPVLVAACTHTDDNLVTQPVPLGMTDKMAPYFDDGESQIYQVQVAVPLPMRRPTAEEAAALGKLPPFPAEPFIKADDVKTEIRFTLTNLDDQKHVVELLVDPWNQFVRYVPGIQIVDNEPAQPDFSGYDKRFILEAKSRVQGTITSDDTRELAVDLATVMVINATPPTDPMANVNGLFNHVFNLQNRSTAPSPLIGNYDGQGHSYIPKVSPAMLGFDLGLRSLEPMNVAVEITVDVQDSDPNTSKSKVVQPQYLDPASSSYDPTIKTYRNPPGTVLTPPKAPVP